MAKLFIGLGSAQGDDQIGWKIADHLALRNIIPVRHATTPAEILHWLEGIETLYLGDACQARAESGAMHRLTWEPGQGFPQVISLRSSLSHQISLPEVLALAASLHLLPKSVVLFAIAGLQFQPGQSLSPSLLHQLPELVESISSELLHA